MPRAKASSSGGSSLGPRRWDPQHPSMLDGVIQEDMQVAAAKWQPTAPPSLAGHTDIRIDFETTGLKWWDGDRPIGVAYHLPATGESGYLPYGHKGGGNLGKEQVIDWLRHEVRGKHIVNSKTNFDVHMARVEGVDLVEQGNTFSDVAFYAALLDDHRNRFSQEILVRDFLADKVLPPDLIGKVKETHGFKLDPAKFSEYPAGLIAIRAIDDVRTVSLLHDVMYPQLVEQDLLRVLDIENQILPVSCEMEWNGAPLDMELLERYDRESQKDLEDALHRIYKRTGISLGTPDKREDLFRLFAQLNIPVPVDPEDGSKTFADAFLRGIPHEVIPDLREAKQLASVRSKFIVKYKNTVDRNGILRYALHQLRTDKGGEDSGKGTVSGRFSSAELAPGAGVNIQQVPAVGKQKKSLISKYIIRKLMRPADPKAQWLAADASQIEYRLFAHYANSETLIKAYVDNPLTDYHDLVGTLIKKVAGKELVREHTKGVNFAQVYGAGIDKMASQLGVERFVAEELAGIYHGMFPEVKPLLQKASQVAKPCCDERCYWRNSGDLIDPRCRQRHRGYVTTYLGRRARFGRTDRHYSALNRVIQGTAADINKRVLIEVYKQRRDLELTMRFTVHDELDSELHNPSKLAQVSEVLNTQYYPFRVPILWKIGTGANWMEAK